ncbi:hypothetical protein DPX16_6605 [Anabarilius grahami]|uniref:Uncharacterized protein n=1 Tax=Anabarilius grahami TaxID=495550 RepID=A0A3N0Z1F6_ANAGA|nr:hypothetical protein DPX16_6605 [Anabarilius grahami]
MNSPLPFCQAVYQDRLRNDVKKTIAVATVPCLSLISFQRLPVQLPLVLLIQTSISASEERTGGDGPGSYTVCTAVLLLLLLLLLSVAAGVTRQPSGTDAFQEKDVQSSCLPLLEEILNT